MAATRSVFSGAKRHALAEVLRPAGFEAGKYMFIRKTSGQIHGIQFQTTKYAGEYFVNIGFHYEFVPPLFAFAAGEIISVQGFDLVDFMYYERLGLLIGADYPRQWSYVGTSDEIKHRLEMNARDAVDVLDRLSRRWFDPAVLMGAVSPAIIEQDLQYLLSEKKERVREWPWLSSPIQKAVGVSWSPDLYGISFSMANIAVHLKNKALARAYLSIARTHSRGKCDEEPLSELTARAENL